MTTTAAMAQVTTAGSRAIADGVKEDNTVAFDTDGEGTKLPIEWGLDTAWPNDGNMQRGIAFIGAENLGTGRASFQPNDLIVDGELSDGQKSDLDNRLRLIRMGGVTSIMLNCDHEVLNSDNYYGKPEEWAKLIEATVKYCQAKGFTVVSVAPFNEPDYTYWGEGTLDDFYQIAKLLKANPLFDNIRICGGNTLNCDQALTWYNGLKEYLDEGNTHQLAGSFDSYANFFATVRADGNHATADELHNVGEAIVGAAYGMQTGVWWGFDGRARGEFCRASNHGERIGYAEDRTHWGAAAVYRRTDEERTAQAFIGSSERQANDATYRFVSAGRDVYFDGYGPVRDFVVDMPGGTGYQTGQTNAEYCADILWGEDVPPYINGDYVIQNASGLNRLLSLPLANTSEASNIVQKKQVKNALYQRWRVTPVDSRIGGDFSYYSIISLGTGSYSLDVLNCSNEEGANIIAYRSNSGAQQQWYLKYIGNGYFYILSRQSNLCLQVKGNGEGATITQGAITGDDRQKWRFVPAELICEYEAPAAPKGLTTTAHSASILLQWEANTETDLAGYTVLRAEKPLIEGADTLFNVIARDVTTAAYLDNTTLQGTDYIYRIKASDKVGNLSEASEAVTAQTSGEKAMIAQWQMEDTLADASENRFDATIYGTYIHMTGQSGDRCVSLMATKGQYLRLPYTVADMREMTICTWVRMRDTSTAWQRIFDFGNGTNQYMFLTPTNGSQMRFVMKNGGDEEILSTTPLKTAWTHVAVTLSDEKVVLYVNGEEVASSTTMTIRPADFHPTLNYIGRSQFPADPALKAYIDDFRIYNYALSPEEVAAVTEDLTYDGIDDLPMESAEVKSVEYYNLSGTRVAAPVKGITLAKYTYTNGKTEVKKIIRH